jgi:two-component system phosphate regulon response regulator PhoB
MRPLILIVEDQVMVLEMLKTLLLLEYEVLSALTGEGALDVVGLIEPDLVLLDIDLGAGMSGLEVCRRLRKSKGGRHVPILILTGTTEPGLTACMAAGANGYLTKPYSPSHLMDRIGALMGAGDGC